MRVLGSESWTKGIYVRKTNWVSLHVQLTTHTQESWLTKHVFLVINELVYKWNICEVVKVVIIFCSTLLLFLIFLWLLSLSSIFASLSLISSFLLIVLLLKLLLGFWSFLFINELCLGNWLMRSWQSGGDLKHLARTFAIRGSDDWGMNVQETSLLEENVGGIGQVVSYSDYSSEGVGSWSQMCLFSQGLHKNILDDVILTSGFGLPWIG